MKIKYGEGLYPFCTFLKAHMHFGASSRMMYDIPGKAGREPGEAAKLEYDEKNGGYIPVGIDGKRGIAIVGDCVDNLKTDSVYNNRVVGGEVVNGEFSYLAIDSKTLLPIIVNPPKKFEDMKKIVSCEPRLIAQMDVYALTTKESKELLEVAKKAVERILSEQIINAKGVVSEEDYAERTRFVDECVVAAKAFIDACMVRDQNKKKISDLTM